MTNLESNKPFCSEQTPEFDNEVTTEVCKIMPELSNKRVLDIIDGIRDNLLVIHGIRNTLAVKQIMVDGIRCLPPDSVNGSFWTSGSRVFGTNAGKGRITTFDTSFFHYAIARGKTELRSAMAISDLSRLDQAGNSVSDSLISTGYGTVSGNVRRESIDVLITKVDKNTEPRNRYMAMFEQLETYLQNI